MNLQEFFQIFCQDLNLKKKKKKIKDSVFGLVEPVLIKNSENLGKCVSSHACSDGHIKDFVTRYHFLPPYSVMPFQNISIKNIIYFNIKRFFKFKIIFSLLKSLILH